MSDTRLTIRISDDTYRLIHKISKEREEAVSTFIRRSILQELALLNYLSEEQMKALGVYHKEEV